MTEDGCSAPAVLAIHRHDDPSGETYWCLAHFERWLQPGDTCLAYSGPERCCFLEAQPVPDEAAHAQVIQFTRSEDGRYWASGFPEEIDISVDLLTVADPQLVRREGDRLHFSAANGEATYVVGEERWGVLLHCARLYTKVW